MSTVAEVKLWGTRIGAVSLADDDAIASFEYDKGFAASGIEVAPLMMPLGRRIYRFPQLGQESFRGMPGLLADSLPDKFGNALINMWLATQGREPDSMNAVERLCYTGTRGMGALEFRPVSGPRARSAAKIEVGRLVALASEVLANRSNLQGSFAGRGKEVGIRNILRVGSSAGGARAKALIAWNPKTNEVRSGETECEEGFKHWLLKFDGVENNRDREADDPKGYGAVEYAYHKMATDAGIFMADCRLLEEGGRRHFMTRRFDRTESGQKLHMQSLGAIAHFDYNMAGAYSYEQAFLTIRQLSLGMDALEEQFRRMVFNIVARNQDDHVKNIAFLMDQSGTWSLSPAFDITYSYQPHGKWTSLHQMTMNGKRSDFVLEDFQACAKSSSLKRGLAKAVLRKIVSVVSQWPDYADACGVLPVHRDRIQRVLRLEW